MVTLSANDERDTRKSLLGHACWIDFFAALLHGWNFELANGVVFSFRDTITIDKDVFR